MKKLFSILLASVLVGLVSFMFAQDYLRIHKSDGTQDVVDVSVIDNITFSADGATMHLNKLDGSVVDYATNTVDSLSFLQVTSTEVSVIYDGNTVTVVNPFETKGVTVTVNGADVVVNSTLTDESLVCRLSGNTTDGSFKIYSSSLFNLYLDGVSITNGDGPAINSQSDVECIVNLVNGTANTLTDGATYATSTEDQKGTFFSEGEIILVGSGSLTVQGNNNHAVCSDTAVEISDGTLIVSGATNDAIHTVYYYQGGGSVTLSSTADGIDADETVEVSGGMLKVNAPSHDVKGVKAGTDIKITSGTIDVTVTGNQSKGFKSGQATTISGGTITFTTSGGVVLEADGSGYDPSYCTAIKADTDVTISGGKVTIISTGVAGKGISPDGSFTMTGGELGITLSGGGSTYTDPDGVLDSYSATGISPDGNCYLYGGTITVSSSGAAGKCISVDGDLIIGESVSSTGPTINASTTGDQFYVSGSGNNTDYANAKAIKSDANVTVNSGTIVITTTKEGGEGLESKAVMTINGGNLDIQTYDDCINASSSVVITGGRIYCYASNNDAIDSNGTISISGGLIVASGAGAPEAGIDCDNNQFTITGGTIIGIGGATSSPTASVSTQRSVVYKGTASNGQLVAVLNSSGQPVLVYKIPRAYSNVVLLFSNPSLANGSYTLYKGGTITGATDEFNGWYEGGTYSGGTQATTFTINGIVTTVGNTGGGGW